jgi:hypothetical protein
LRVLWRLPPRVKTAAEIASRSGVGAHTPPAAGGWAGVIGQPQEG